MERSYSTLTLGAPGAGTVELSARGYSTDLAQLVTIAAGGGYAYARLAIVAASAGTAPVTANSAIASRSGWG